MPHAAVSRAERARAKNLRVAMTRAETLLWRYLKAHHVDRLGFRRQVPMQQYIADFACHSARLIVEIDGASHDFEARQRRDAARDRWFQSQGYRVLRFTNEQVLTNLTGVIEAIREASCRNAPPSLSLPHKGGGNAQISARDDDALAQSLAPTLPRKRGKGRAAARGNTTP
jgi:very-short-patch-repair endonuclease